MSSDSPIPPQGQPKQLNLQQLAGQFMAGVQRHFDNLAFNQAARMAVTEASFDEQVKRPGIMPAAPFHQNFEQMQAYTLDLLHRQVIGDSLNLAGSVMNNVHLFLALLKGNGTNLQVDPEVQRQVQQEQQEFVRIPLDQKFDRLEKNYGVVCPLEDTITSLGLAMQALMQQNGMVGERQLDESGELAFELQAPREGQVVTTPQIPKDAIEPLAKVFRNGDRVLFSDTELPLVFVTVAIFADNLFGSVARYGRDLQAGE
jgi:hypothetical protein|tara:strand:+ start:737 stop:1510 length:774 start_codon:yes stop_codon:yes gene_type:complete